MTKLKVHRVIRGPIEDPEYEDSWFNNCLIEIEGDTELVEDDIYFDDFDEAYNFMKHFDTSIDPIEIELKGDFMSYD